MGVVNHVATIGAARESSIIWPGSISCSIIGTRNIRIRDFPAKKMYLLELRDEV